MTGVGAVRGTVTSRIGPALFGCLCCACRVHVRVVSCATLLVLSFIWRGLSHLERFEFVIATPCLDSRLPLTSWVPLSSFLPCVLVLPFALFY